MDDSSTKPKVNQGSSQTFPYSVTLIGDSTTTVIQVISQITHGVEDLSTEDKELKYLTPAVKIVKSPTADTIITKEATAITPTVLSTNLDVQNNLKQPTSVPAPSFTSDTGTDSIPTALPPVASTNLFQSVDATLPPTPMAAPTPPASTPGSNTDATTIVEDSDLIPSNADNVNQFDIVPTLATVVTESDLETPVPTVMTDATSMVGLDDSVPGVMKKVGSGLNFTNMTTTSTGTSKPTLEPGLVEGAAAIDTPFLSFGSSTSVLLAVVIGFGLIMG